MTDQEKILELEQRVGRLENIIKNLSHNTENLFVGVMMKDGCYIHTTLRQYIKEYCYNFEYDDKKCKTCKYYLYAFEGHPCVNCRRNFKLVDEIREQKNDLWKENTFNGR